MIPEGVQDADIDSPGPPYPLLHSDVRKRAIHAPIFAHTLFLTIVTAESSPLTPLLLLLLVCEEQPRHTLHERMERHPHMFLRKCQEWHARRVLRGEEQRMSPF